MLTTPNSQGCQEKASVPSTSGELRGSLQDQALVAHGEVEEVVSSFRKTLIKKAESVCLYNGVRSCYEQLP